MKRYRQVKSQIISFFAMQSTFSSRRLLLKYVVSVRHGLMCIVSTYILCGLNLFGLNFLKLRRYYYYLLRYSSMNEDLTSYVPFIFSCVSFSWYIHLLCTTTSLVHFASLYFNENKINMSLMKLSLNFFILFKVCSTMYLCTDYIRTHKG